MRNCVSRLMRSSPAVATMAIAVGSLQACGHTPVTSLYHLARFDPMMADPAVLRAAVRLPAALRPRTDGVQLVLGYKGAGGPDLEERLVLRSMKEEESDPRLRAERKAGTTLTVYALDPAEIGRLLAVRREIAAREAAAERGEVAKGSGSLSVSAAACAATTLPEGPLLMTTYLMWDAASGYVPVTGDVDLRDLATPDQIAAAVPPCS